MFDEKFPYKDKEIKPSFNQGDEQTCIIEKYFRDNPDKHFVMISCPCKKCRPWC